MAEFTINVSDEECIKCLNAVLTLNDIPHLKSMSINSIAETAGLKATKCRAVIDELVLSDKLIKYQATENPKIQRYYYVVSSEGRKFLEENKRGKKP